jgi:hypothetical protein
MAPETGQSQRDRLASPYSDHFNPHEWWKAIDERNARIVEDNRRQIEQLEARQREREKQAAEIEAATERDRQAYRERGWPA